MYKFNQNFKSAVKGIVLLFVSREFAFIYCIFGTASQVAHTYYCTSGISSYTGWQNTINAVILSTFISTALLFFTAIATKGHSTTEILVRQAVNIFTAVEILVNLYYYTRHLIVEPMINVVDKINFSLISISNWFDFFFAVIISVLIPISIKMFATHIRALEWVEIEDELIKEKFKLSNSGNNGNGSNVDDNLNNEKIVDIVNKMKNDFDSKIKQIDAEIVKSFKKNSQLFINQFENKLKTKIKNYEASKEN